MPSKSGYFGSGFAQGFGQSLGQLPGLLLAIHELGEKEKDRESLTENRNLRNSLLKKQISMAETQEKYVQSFEPIIESYVASGGLQSLLTGGAPPGSQPDPALAQFAESQGSPGTLFPETQQAEPQAGFMPKPSFSLGPTGPRIGMQFEPKKFQQQFQLIPQPDGTAVLTRNVFDPSTGKNQQEVLGMVPTEKVRQAVETAQITGQDPAELLIQSQLSPSTREEVVLGGLTGAQERASARKIREKSAEAAAVSGARTTASQEAERRPARRLIETLRQKLSGIDLPKSGGERITKSFTLTAESLAQSNQNLVLFETLKEGFLATLVRAGGERGALTDQDIARARALMPNLLPRKGRLPDTEETARNKLKQLEELFGQFVQKDPMLADELGQVMDRVSPMGKTGARPARAGKAQFRYEPGKGLVPLGP